MRLVAVPGLLIGLILAVAQPTEIPEEISSDALAYVLEIESSLESSGHSLVGFWARPYLFGTRR